MIFARNFNYRQSLRPPMLEKMAQTGRAISASDATGMMQ
jgi:hypothetical protein